MSITIYSILLHETISPDERRSVYAEDLLGESVFYTEPKNRRPDVYSVIRERNNNNNIVFHFASTSSAANIFFSSFTGATAVFQRGRRRDLPTKDPR